MHTVEMKAEDPKLLRLNCLSDLTSAVAIRDTISDAMHKHQAIVLDISASEDVGLTFLQTLVSARKSAAAMGKSVSIHLPEDAVASAQFTASGISWSDFPDRIELDLASFGPASEDSPELPVSNPAADAAADEQQASIIELPVEDPSIDKNALVSLVKELGAPAVEESLAVFFAELDDRIKLLQQLSLDADLRVILREAHSLKGTAGTFGLRRLAQYGADLEREARTLAPSEYHSMLSRMAAMFETSRKQLPAASTLAA
jgi:HPt (histidine-containing phosphotransfer) domain-containing protein/anti-anti-sigma regulatory factor